MPKINFVLQQGHIILIYKNVLAFNNCVLVSGGFGTRGIEGKIAAAKYARTTKKPYLGICLGTFLNKQPSLYSLLRFQSTVKPVYNDHPWDREKVVVVWRWSLFRGSK